MNLPKKIRQCKVCNKPLGKDKFNSKVCSRSCFYKNKKSISKDPQLTEPIFSKSQIKRLKVQKLDFDSKLSPGESAEKPITIVDKRYTDFVRKHACVVNRDCNGEVIYHHTEYKGMGKKGSDYSCIPLCSLMHHTGSSESIHQLGRDSFEKKFNINIDKIIIKLLQEYISLQNSLKDKQ